MKYKALVFDMDGTILDTLVDLMNSVNEGLRTLGYPERTLDEIRRFVGNGVKMLTKRAIPEGSTQEELEQLRQIQHDFYEIHCADHTGPYEGILDLLKEVKKRGYLLAVVSNKVDPAVQELCAKYFPGIFDTAVGDQPAFRVKPAPDSVFEALKRLGVEQKDAVYIGDSEVDLQTAKNAGLDCISVTWGFRDEDFLKEQGASTFAHAPLEVLNYV